VPEVQLRVDDARQRDVYRGIARIDQATMQTLGISAGDVIEISGKRTTAAIAWPAYSEDQKRGIIRIDASIVENCWVNETTQRSSSRCRFRYFLLLGYS